MYKLHGIYSDTDLMLYNLLISVQRWQAPELIKEVTEEQ